MNPCSSQELFCILTPKMLANNYLILQGLSLLISVFSVLKVTFCLKHTNSLRPRDMVAQ